MTALSERLLRAKHYLCKLWHYIIWEFPNKVTPDMILGDPESENIYLIT